MVSGMVLVLVGLFALSWAREYYQIFLSQGVCCGLGGALLYVPTMALVSTSFRRRRTLAMGVVTCGVGLGMLFLCSEEGGWSVEVYGCDANDAYMRIGGVIYVVAFQQLLPRIGFSWTVRALAFIALGVFMLSTPNLFSKNPASVSTATITTTSKRKLFDKNAITNRAFQIYSVSSFFIFLGYLVPFFYMPSFAEIVLRTATTTGFWALAVSSGTSILGRLLIAFIGQNFGVMVPWVVSAAASAVLCFCWVKVTTLTSFFAFCALYGRYRLFPMADELGRLILTTGFFSGALVALPPSIFHRMCKDQNLLGTWLGMGWVCSGTAFLVGSPIAGALASVGNVDQDNGSFNFLALQLFSGSSLLVGSALLLYLWMTLLKNGERRAGSVLI